MSYEVRSNGEVIFECETAEEFQDRLLEIEMADARGELKHSDLDGSAWMQTHDGDGNLLVETPLYQQLQEELRQGREAVEKLKRIDEIMQEFKKESKSAESQVDMGYMACVAADRVVNLIKEQRESK